MDLFDAFASLDKTFVARPGSHSTSDDDDEAKWATFVADRLLNRRRLVAAICWGQIR